jgi:hypothetical protein
MIRRAWFLSALLALAVASSFGRAEYPFVFRDVGDETGAFPHLGGIRGHGAAWGDIDGSGWPSLFVGTFHNAGSKPGMLLRNYKSKFQPDDLDVFKVSAACSGALFVDLTNSGRLDLYVSNNAHAATGERSNPNLLLRNDGGGKFSDVSRESGACPPGLQGRSVAALDFDGDGLLDLISTDFYYSTKAKYGCCLFRNKGGHHFEDVAAAVGLPTGTAIAGVAVADVNDDTYPDLFLTLPDGSNRLYLNDGKGKFREAPGTREVFAWKGLKAEDSPTGVCIADLNRDGLPDIVVGHHFKAPWQSPTSIRLYLNRGIKDGVPTYEDVTEAAGLTPLAMKAPHIEIQDFDNDGWPDISVSIVKFKDGKPYPVIYRNLGVRDGIPRFRDDAWAINDFPTAEDRAMKGSGPLFNKVLKEGKIIYGAAGPTADFDRDGRRDYLLVNWWIESRSLLLRNETKGGHWLTVLVTGRDGVNRMGVGSRVRLYKAGQLDKREALLGDREIAIGYGWCSGQEADAHFGLGAETEVDVEVTLPHRKGTITQKGVKAGQRLTIRQ